MAAVAVYNERLKLLAAALNLIAVGMIAVGVTTPLVYVSYGVPPIGAVPFPELVPALLVWLACAFVTHGVAHWVLGSLI